MNAQVWRQQRSIGVLLVFMIGLVVVAAYFSVKEKRGAAIYRGQGLKRLAGDGLTAVGKDLDTWSRRKPSRTTRYCRHWSKSAGRLVSSPVAYKTPQRYYRGVMYCSGRGDFLNGAVCLTSSMP